MRTPSGYRGSGHGTDSSHSRHPPGAAGAGDKLAVPFLVITRQRGPENPHRRSTEPQSTVRRCHWPGTCFGENGICWHLFGICKVTSKRQESFAFHVQMPKIPCTFSSLYLSQLQLNSNYFCAYLMSSPQYRKSQQEAHDIQAPLNIDEGMCLGRWKEGVCRGGILDQLFYLPGIPSLLPAPNRVRSLVSSSLPNSARYLHPNSLCTVPFNTLDYVKPGDLAFQVVLCICLQSHSLQKGFGWNFFDGQVHVLLLVSRMLLFFFHSCYLQSTSPNNHHLLNPSRTCSWAIPLPIDPAGNHLSCLSILHSEDTNFCLIA